MIMRSLGRGGVIWLVLAATCFLVSCMNMNRGTEFNLTTYEGTNDQRKIAEFYNHEAARHRQMVQDLFHRVVVYKRLFGHGSDWVEGTRVLAQSYEDAAQERERTATQHSEVIQDGPASSPIRPESR